MLKKILPKPEEDAKLVFHFRNNPPRTLGFLYYTTETVKSI